MKNENTLKKNVTSKELLNLIDGLSSLLKEEYKEPEDEASLSCDSNDDEEEKLEDYDYYEEEEDGSVWASAFYPSFTPSPKKMKNLYIGISPDLSTCVSVEADNPNNAMIKIKQKFYENHIAETMMKIFCPEDIL